MDLYHQQLTDNESFNGENFELFQRKEKKIPLAMVTSVVNGKECEGLLDTGSQYSMMSIGMALDLD